jgi:hypothetical protein
MKPMTCKASEINIYDINYPCYLSDIPPDGQRIAHIPGEFEYRYLEGVKSYVIEAYKTKDKLYVFDVVPLHLWKKSICRIPYEKRLKALHRIVTEQIADFAKVVDLAAVLVENPFELSDYCDGLLTKGTERVRIMDVNGNYVFGECTNGEYMELKL